MRRSSSSFYLTPIRIGGLTVRRLVLRNAGMSKEEAQQKYIEKVKALMA